MTSLMDQTSNYPRFQDSSSCRPMMLKDFLREENGYQYSCSSSSSLNGFPLMCPKRKRPCKSRSNEPPAVLLLGSWPRKAAAMRLSAVHRVMSAVKFLRTVKSPLRALPRSGSRKSAEGEVDNFADGNKPMVDGDGVIVKVKDILRWRSFRDVAEDESAPSDFQLSPSESGWRGQDFTVEDLLFWGGENEDWGKKCCLGANAASLRKSKGDWSLEECEQQSPVSVLDGFPFQQVREPSVSPLHQALAQGTKCVEKIQELDNITKPKPTSKDRFGIDETNAVEETVRQLLRNLEKDTLCQHASNDMIMDFLMHELSMSGKVDNPKFHNEIIGIAKSWIFGEYDNQSYCWEVEDKREAYVKDMDKGVSWNKFGQQQEEISTELAVEVLDELVEGVLIHFLSK